MSSENMTKTTQFLIQSAAIAALYVILTFVSNAAGLANGVIQLRLSEALTILPIFSAASVPGLFTGCILANLLTGCSLWDIIFGSLATLIGALGTRFFRKKKILPFFPPIIANTVIIPLVLSRIYHFEGSIWYFALTVGIGEILSCGVLGFGLFKLLKRTEDQIHWI